jgi:glycosyltransferase involved in cell wall biosynthesis
MINPILSILIPTKNRSTTAIIAIENVLSINSNDFELVIQDCSDDDVLFEIINARFGDDKRLRYFKSSANPSLTQNWNLAISNSTGKYLCGIGDDDGVMPYIVEIAFWMRDNNIKALLGSLVNYIWKDAHIGTFSSGKLTFDTNYTGKIFKIDLQNQYQKKIINCGFGYAEDIPNIYHGIVERDIFIQHYKHSDCFLSGTSFDVYNAFIIPNYLEASYFVDIPITVRGTSKASNANRIYSKNGYDIHLKEFGDYYLPDFLPKVWSAEVSITESTIVALKDIGKFELVYKMNLAVVYGKIAAHDFKNVLSYFSQYTKNKNKDFSNRYFFVYLYKFIVDKYFALLKDSVLKILFLYVKCLYDYILKSKKKIKVDASNIRGAVDILNNHLKTCNIHFGFSISDEEHMPSKAPWD